MFVSKLDTRRREKFWNAASQDDYLVYEHAVLLLEFPPFTATMCEPMHSRISIGSSAL